MEDVEARVRCIEVAATLTPLDRDPKTVVEIARVLYDFCNAPPVAETQPGIVDKPRRGRPPKAD